MGSGKKHYILAYMVLVILDIALIGWFSGCFGGCCPYQLCLDTSKGRIRIDAPIIIGLILLVVGVNHLGRWVRKHLVLQNKPAEKQ
ncbi:MAG: hypothetical protein ABIH11_08985 [Candidatus Altiarchaeota archaeon]